MAERRMFAKTIIDSDTFLDMLKTAQLLYFHLALNADDDGFINKPRAIMRTCACNEEDMNVLIENEFIYSFESGIVVIKHWNIHNTIQKDRYHETNCKTEKSMLSQDKNKAYVFIDNNSSSECIQSVNNLDTQSSLEEDSLNKNSEGEDISESDDSTPHPSTQIKKQKYGEYNNVLLTDEELMQLQDEFQNWEELIENLSSYMASKGKKYKSHFATIRRWSKNDNPIPDTTKPVYQKKTKADELQESYDMIRDWGKGEI
ncbi:MAG: replisome organizer [Lachnospiraceae bacterium]|nr:replisome organizer [Lachnospiraceae bacterium]